MRILFGYATSRTDEVPEILYLGHDGAELERIAAESKFPALSVLDDFRPFRSIRHFTQEAAEAFAALDRPGRAPTIEEGLAMVARIAELEKQLAQAQAVAGPPSPEAPVPAASTAPPESNPPPPVVPPPAEPAPAPTEPAPAAAAPRSRRAGQ